MPPPGTYAQIMPCSGLALNHCIDTKAGVIDNDYHGNIAVVLHNYGSQHFHIKIRDCIAQLVFLHISLPQHQLLMELDMT